MDKIYIRSELNRILFDMIGDWDLVAQWWHSENKAFDDKTPLEIYWSGPEGRVSVTDYICHFADPHGL